MEQGLCNSRASGQLSVPSFNSCCAYRWFAAEHLMGRTNRSTAAGTSAQQQRCHRMAFSSKCGQCYADSRVDEAEHRLVNTVVILTTFSAFHECVCPWLDSNATKTFSPYKTRWQTGSISTSPDRICACGSQNEHGSKGSDHCCTSKKHDYTSKPSVQLTAAQQLLPTQQAQ